MRNKNWLWLVCITLWSSHLMASPTTFKRYQIIGVMASQAQSVAILKDTLSGRTLVVSPGSSIPGDPLPLQIRKIEERFVQVVEADGRSYPLSYWSPSQNNDGVIAQLAQEDKSEEGLNNSGESDIIDTYQWIRDKGRSDFQLPVDLPFQAKGEAEP